MGNIREIGLGVQDNREEAARRRIEEEQRPTTQMLLNKWAFRSSCVKASAEYNGSDPTEDLPANDLVCQPGRTT